MNTDPDLLPLTGAWIDNAASGAEQRLLHELLNEDPSAMDAFAGVCHLDALLTQRRYSPDQRHAALAQMLSGKPWLLRCEEAVMRYPRRFAIMIAALAGLALVPFLVPDSEAEKIPAHSERPGRIYSGQPVASKRTTETQVLSEKSLKQELRSLAVPCFLAKQPLPQAVDHLLRLIRVIDPALPVTADVRTAGDAPVHLDLVVTISALGLLEMMAFQTGTTVNIEEGVLVFHEGPSPETENATYMSRTLCSALCTVLPAMPDETDPEILAGQLNQAFGTSWTLARPGEDPPIKADENPELMVEYHRTAREKSVLAKAMSSVIPDKVKFQTTIITVPPDLANGSYFNIIRNLDAPAADDSVQKQTAVGQCFLWDEAKFPNHPLPANLSALLSSGRATLFHSSTSISRAGAGVLNQTVETLSEATPTQPAAEQFAWKLVYSGKFAERDAGRINFTATDTRLEDDFVLNAPLRVPERCSAVLTHLNPDTGVGTFIILKMSRTYNPPSGASLPDAGQPEPLGVRVTGSESLITSPHDPEHRQIDASGLPWNFPLKCPATGKLFLVP